MNFVTALRAVVGNASVLVGARATRAYRIGFRYGEGKALAVVRPRSLIELWQVLQCCVGADKVVILQASNTGLTGGSTPDGDDYDRDVVVINTMRLAGVHVIDEGRQVICLPGATLHELERVLEPYGREPHSVIGSSCLGASVVGGICNNSGGALVRRGPAYTDMALYAQRDHQGELRLVNHLGVRLGENPKEILRRLERGQFAAGDIEHHPGRRGSDCDYERRVRAIEADSPARFNADPGRLFEASGSAGKVAVFAVRLDTFLKEHDTRVFYIGTRDPAELTALRRHVLGHFTSLPVAAEYLHRDLFEVAERYGKDTFLAIRYLGTRRLPAFFRFRRAWDAFACRMPLQFPGSSDAWLQRLSRLFPQHLPARMREYRDRFPHHLLLKMAGPGITEAAEHLRSVFPSASGDFCECTDEEAAKAFLHRFVAAGAAMRYRAIHANEVEALIALDIALKRNERDWFEALPADIGASIVRALYYGHFLCHVFHQDYLVRKGTDVAALEHRLRQFQDERGAEYPAEHNVGHLYRAKPLLAAFYRQLDPCNSFNPGIGKTSKRTYWEGMAGVVCEDKQLRK